MVAGAQGGDPGARAGDDAGRFVAEDEGTVGGPVAGHDVEVRVAHAGRADVDLDLARSGGAQRHLTGAQARAGLEDDGGGELRRHQDAFTSSGFGRGPVWCGSRVWGLARTT